MDLKPGESAGFTVDREWLDTATEIVIYATCECGFRNRFAFPISEDGLVERHTEKLCRCGILCAFEIKETQ